MGDITHHAPVVDQAKFVFWGSRGPKETPSKRRARIGGAAAEGLPACASGEHKAEDGDPETSEHVLMYLCAVNLQQCAAAALKYSFAT